MYTVYALIHPLLTRGVFYIGLTERDVSQRFKEHVYYGQTNSANKAIIASLHEAQVMVRMETLEQVATKKEGEERETYWMHHDERLGHPLTNNEKDRDWVEPSEEEKHAEEEALYWQYGWKTYLKIYGTHGRCKTLAEIVQGENLDASEILAAIQEGIIVDPTAMRLYARVKLAQTKAFWKRTVANHPEPEMDYLKERAAIALQITEEECLPLLQGETLEEREHYAAPFLVSR